jgi:hypothetical protein
VSERDDLYRQHGELVDKKFAHGLTPQEQHALALIRHRLDQIEPDHLAPLRRIAKRMRAMALDLDDVAAAAIDANRWELYE